MATTVKWPENLYFPDWFVILQSKCYLQHNKKHARKKIYWHCVYLNKWNFLHSLRPQVIRGEDLPSWLIERFKLISQQVCSGDVFPHCKFEWKKIINEFIWDFDSIFVTSNTHSQCSIFHQNVTNFVKITKIWPEKKSHFFLSWGPYSAKGVLTW